MDTTMKSIKDFGDPFHVQSREPFFHDAGYVHGRLHNLSGAIMVSESGEGMLPGCKVSLISKKNQKAEMSGDGEKETSPDEKQTGTDIARDNVTNNKTQNKSERIQWSCTATCRQLSQAEVDIIIGLKNLFGEDIEVLREGLETIDHCPYQHGYKQEWDVQYKTEKKQTTFLCDKGPVLRMGHPLVCHLEGSECISPLRILRNALVHYPQFGQLKTCVYQCIARLKLVKDIDVAIASNDFDMLLACCQMTFSSMFQQKCDSRKQSSGDSVTLNTPFRVPYLEAALLCRYADVVHKYEKTVRDYLIIPCVCCERLFRRCQCTPVSFDDLDDKLVWLVLTAYVIMSNPDDEETYYLCNHCKPIIKTDTMPARCVLNGLVSEPIPDELKGIDAFSLQLIQLAKAFVTVIRLKSYSHKVPTYNSLKASKGNMFVLPLPLQDTTKTLELNECGLPKPKLLAKVDGLPTNKKVVWRKFVNITKIKAALTKLREINWLYAHVSPDKVEKSVEDLFIEVANSASSTMVKKVKNKSLYEAGLQPYTIRSLDSVVPTGTDTDQYKMVKVDEYPLKTN